MLQNPEDISEKAKEIELGLLPAKCVPGIIKNMIHLTAGKKITG
jgi:hypothetical protein